METKTHYTFICNDFGFCGPADKPLGSIYGNLPYIAPEVINGKGYTFASDIYSFGMLMWEISSGQPPFAGLEHNYDLVMKIMNGMRPIIVPGTPLEYANLIRRKLLEGKEYGNVCVCKLKSEKDLPLFLNNPVKNGEKVYSKYVKERILIKYQGGFASRDETLLQNVIHDGNRFWNVSHDGNCLRKMRFSSFMTYGADAILRLHHENSIHRDLHSGNILYTKNIDFWVISDFRFCGPADKLLGSIYGNLPYIAPEVIFGKGYTFASDIYSIGMLMWEISSGQLPFAGYEHNYDLVMKIMNGMRPKIIPGTPLVYANLMVQCWDADPFKRPKINILRKKILQMRNL
ncbi:9941_t:CDS:2 [Funneliformis geosporum]|uniref:9941_t:CDS:1 n=1 Tax=Funneliformis geosporum TaxID=1117311 RepID=A0A9W4SFK6_9GLOM|nr:9941_t:CDS:2 [Funneliformis geosporum]